MSDPIAALVTKWHEAAVVLRAKAALHRGHVIGHILIERATALDMQADELEAALRADADAPRKLWTDKALQKVAFTACPQNADEHHGGAQVYTAAFSWHCGACTRILEALRKVADADARPPQRQIIKAAFVEGFCAGVAQPEMGTESAWQESQTVQDSLERPAGVPRRAEPPHCSVCGLDEVLCHCAADTKIEAAGRAEPPPEPITIVGTCREGSPHFCANCGRRAEGAAMTPKPLQGESHV